MKRKFQKLPFAIALFSLFVLVAGCQNSSQNTTTPTEEETATDDVTTSDLESLRPSEQFARLNEQFAEAQKTGDARPEDFADRFWKLAEQYPDDRTAYASLRWIANLVDDPEWRDRALVEMAESYPEHDDLGQICVRLMDRPPTDGGVRFLETLMEKSPKRQLKAMATMALASALSHVDAEHRDDARVEQLYQTVIDEYGDLQDLKKYAEDQLYVFRNLNVGRVAPDIVGEDLDGQPFKLSDYRGKVVMLDFWGDW